MFRLVVTRWCAFGLVASLGSASTAAAQLPPRPDLRLVSSTAAVPLLGEIHGVVHDDRGEPLSGAVVSALGSATAFAVSDREGRFVFRNLPTGSYLVRAHLQGHLPARGRLVYVSPEGRSISMIALSRLPDTAEPHDPMPVLDASPTAAGAVEGPNPSDTHDQNEVAWRLRHVRRSVLKTAHVGMPGADGDSFFEDPFASFGRAMETSARMASALFTDLPLTGQVNFLTTTSFERPQDLFSPGAGLPQPVAYLALMAPVADGEWMVRGAVTQGDLASWVVAGSYERHAGAHDYEAGLSYSMQRYLGGNAEALAAMRDGSRNVGAVHAHDRWAATSRLTVGYGARVARYDYLADRNLVSPRASLTVQPMAHDSLRVRATASHRETAPGAEEFLPPVVGLWLPPERTFSSVAPGGELRAERLDHLELAAERQWGADVVVGVRAFHQRGQDQIVTLFGAPDHSSIVGHYRVGSAGDFEARGWGVSVSRAVRHGTSASIDYTQADAEWSGWSADHEALARVAGTVVRHAERMHDLTATMQSLLAPTGTRVYVMYKLNTAFASNRVDAVLPAIGGRFDLQVNQSLPFLRVTGAQWETLIAISNLFREDVMDGSVYDELLVVRPPKRVLGGVTVKF